MQSQAPPAHIVVESPSFRDGQAVPREYTADGPNTSPPLTWRNVPPKATELVLTMEDQDEHPPVAQLVPRLHWVMYNILPAVREVPAGLPAEEVVTAPVALVDALQAYTVFDSPGYRGPQPPPGQLHHYRFTVYALDETLGLRPGMGANSVLRALKGHVIGEGSITATYQRKP